MPEIVPVNKQIDTPIPLHLLTRIRHLAQRIDEIRNVPVIMLSRCLTVTMPRLINLPNHILRCLTGRVDGPNHFDNFLHVDRADLLLRVPASRQALSQLYTAHEEMDTTDQTTSQAFFQLLYYFLKGSLAEPLPINTQARQCLADALLPAKREHISQHEYDRRILHYLANRFLAIHPEFQTFVSLPLALAYISGGFSPLLQRLLFQNPLALMFSLLSQDPPGTTATSPDSCPLPDLSGALSIWDQSAAQRWLLRPPVDFLAGHTARTLNTPAQSFPVTDLPPGQCFEFSRPLPHSEAPQCAFSPTKNGTDRFLPADTRIHRFTATDSAGNNHQITQLQIGSSALRVGQINTLQRSDLPSLLPIRALNDDIRVIPSVQQHQNALTLRQRSEHLPLADLHVPVSPESQQSLLARTWEIMSDALITSLDLNFPPLVKGEAFEQKQADYQGRFLIPSTPLPITGQRTQLVEDFIATLQHKYALYPDISSSQVRVRFQYAEGSPGEKNLPLTAVLAWFRGNDYVAIYPDAWYQNHPDAIKEIENYRGYNRSTATPFSERFTQADLQRVKRNNLWPAKEDVNPLDFIKTLAGAFNFSPRETALVMYKDGFTARNVPLSKILTLVPDIIQNIYWPQSIPHTAANLLERYRTSTVFFERKDLLLEIALNKLPDAGEFSLTDMLRQIRHISQAAPLSGLEIRTSAAALLNNKINALYDEYERTSQLQIAPANRLNNASQVWVEIYEFDGGYGGLKKTATRSVALERVAYGELQRTYGINYSFKVEVPAVLNPLFAQESRIYSSAFPVTDALYVELRSSTLQCQHDDACFSAIAEIQRLLINYRIASYLVTISEKTSLSWRDHIERNLLSTLLQHPDSYNLIKLVEFDGETMATYFAIRGAGQMLLFNTLSDQVIILQEQQPTHLSDAQAGAIFRSLPLSYSMRYARDKARLNILSAKDVSWDHDNSIGKYRFVTPGASALHQQMTENIFDNNLSDIDALFHTSSEVWLQFALDFSGDFFTGLSYALDLIACKSLGLTARLVTAIAGLASNSLQLGISYSLAKLTAEEDKNDNLHRDFIIALLFGSIDLLTLSHGFHDVVRKKITRLRGFKTYLTSLNNGGQTQRSIRFLERGKWGRKLTETQVRIPFNNFSNNLRYGMVNIPGMLPTSMLMMFLGNGRRNARHLILKAIDALMKMDNRPLVERILRLFFARSDDLFIKNYLKDLKLMKRDLNEINVRKHITLAHRQDEDPNTVMTAELRNYEIFRRNYEAIKRDRKNSGENEIERYQGSVLYVSKENLVAYLRSCGVNLLDCLSILLIHEMSHLSANTLDYVYVGHVGGSKGILDLDGVININDKDYTVPVQYRGKDETFRKANMAGYQSTSAGYRNADSFSLATYLLGSLSAKDHVEQVLTKLEKALIKLPA
ncbi:hypothetical protein SC171_21840 [Pantoea cypripedii]|uniref:hypothetical protein n=1 Tax=Pantoea cypripedii TaxID=55209 RepID=UPI002FC823BD